MINLLSPEEKEKLLMEKINKIILIHWFLIFFFLICFVAVLFSIKVYFKSQANLYENTFFSLKNESEIKKIEEFRQYVKRMNIKISGSNEFYKNKIYFSDMLEKISQTLPENIFLNNLSINSDLAVFLSGFSLKVEDLLALKDNLKEEEGFSNIYFPPANWVKPENINFSASFSITK